MLPRHLLSALGAGIAAKDDQVARDALKRIDPIVRRSAQRRLGRALIDAELACENTQPDPVHVMQLAALIIDGKRVDAPGDPAAVARAYAALPAVTMPRLPVWSIATGVIAAAIVSTLVIAIATRPGAKPRAYARPLPAPSQTAFRDGGVPLTDPAIDHLLSEDLTNLVVEASRAQAKPDGDIAGRLRGLRDAPAIAARGAAVTEAWRAMIDAFGEGFHAAQLGLPTARAEDHLREAARTVSEQFGKAGLGYFIEGRFKRQWTFLQAYRVEEVVMVIANATPHRVLSLRKLDKLNTRYALLGVESEDLGDPLLFLDQTDDYVATTVFPVLAPGTPYPLGDARDWMLTEPGKSLAVAAGDAVRRELAGVLGDDAAAASQIAALLRERAELVQGWRDILERKHMAMVTTDDLFLPDGLLDALEGGVPSTQRHRVEAIEEELADLEAPRIVTRVRDLVTATVRRHEAQHGLDEERDTELRYPEALRSMLGPEHDDEGNPIAIVRATRPELSAYVSQIANDPSTTQLTMWKIFSEVFDRNAWGEAHSYAAITVLEGLARHLGAPALEGPRFHHGLDRNRLVPAIKQVLAASPDAIRKAAAELWVELYGEPLVPITDAPARGVIASRS